MVLNILELSSLSSRPYLMREGDSLPADTAVQAGG